MKDLFIKYLCGRRSERDTVKELLANYSNELSYQDAYLILSYINLDSDITRKLLDILKTNNELFFQFLIKNKCKNFNNLTISNKEYVLNLIDFEAFKVLVDNFKKIQIQYKKIYIKNKNKMTYFDNVYKSLMVYDKLR